MLVFFFKKDFLGVLFCSCESQRDYAHTVQWLFVNKEALSIILSIWHDNDSFSDNNGYHLKSQGS